jgi:hypothetical protein
MLCNGHAVAIAGSHGVCHPEALLGGFPHRSIGSVLLRLFETKRKKIHYLTNNYELVIHHQAKKM